MLRAEPRAQRVGLGIHPRARRREFRLECRLALLGGVAARDRLAPHRVQVLTEPARRIEVGLEPLLARRRLGTVALQVTLQAALRLAQLADLRVALHQHPAEARQFRIQLAYLALERLDLRLESGELERGARRVAATLRAGAGTRLVAHDHAALEFGQQLGRDVQDGDGRLRTGIVEGVGAQDRGALVGELGLVLERLDGGHVEHRQLGRRLEVLDRDLAAFRPLTRHDTGSPSTFNRQSATAPGP